MYVVGPTCDAGKNAVKNESNRRPTPIVDSAGRPLILRVQAPVVQSFKEAVRQSTGPSADWARLGNPPW